MNCDSTIVVVGTGNIGVQAVYMLAGMDVSKVILIDHDEFSQDNIGKQNIRLEDIGKPKVEVCAAALQHIQPGLNVEIHPHRVEQVPVGRLARVDLILLCVDNLAARLYVNQLAWNFGIPFVDCAVGFERYVRVRVIIPRRNHACIECGLGDLDYDQLDATYPCQGESPASPSTTSTLELGAIAAGLQCAEAKKVLAGDLPSLSHQIFLDLHGPCISNYTYTRNQGCRFNHNRFSDHITIVDDTRSLKSLDAMRSITHACRDGFLQRVICKDCHQLITVETPIIWQELANMRCECGGSCDPVSIATAQTLSIENLSATAMAAPLLSFGFRPGDVIVVDDKTYEIGSTHAN